MAFTLTVPLFSLERDAILPALEERGVQVNDYFRDYIAHPDFRPVTASGSIRVTVATLRELGFDAPVPHGKLDLPPLEPVHAVYLRMALDQAPSADPVLRRGKSPEGAIQVYTVPLRQGELLLEPYLRRVGETCWLRTARFDADWPFGPDCLFAFRQGM